MKKILLSVISIMLVSFFYQVNAQENEIKLRLSRDFGYSSGRGDIQGTFSMKVTGPESLTRVTFYLDNNQLGEDLETPYQLRFNTDNYDLGLHTLFAVGTTSNGEDLRSNEITANFVTPEEGWKAGLGFAGPVLGLVFGVMILSFVLAFLTERKSKNLPPGTPRKYGIAGGTICPRCNRPFALHMLAPNVLVGKLDRCPYCGKWSTVHTRSMNELRAAEAAELLESQERDQVPEESKEEKLRKEMEESKFL